MTEKLFLHTVSMVIPLPNYLLYLEFSDGTRKIYDVNRWARHTTLAPVFKELKAERGLFERVKVAPSGVGIVWNDDIDFCCNDLYRYGQTINNTENSDGNGNTSLKPKATRTKKVLTSV